jgi:uncharacterized protein (TIGR02594 family)
MNKAYKLALEQRGLREIPGTTHNPEVVQMFADVGHGWVKDDETAWCAAFVGAMLKRAGMAHTGKLNARSYATWGTHVDPASAQVGDLVVFWRGSPEGWQGHVGFFVRYEGSQVLVLGGNQSNAVNFSEYPKSKMLAVRRSPNEIEVEATNPASKNRTSPAKSTTLQAAAGAAVSGAGSAAYAVGQLDSTAQIVVAVGAVVAGLCLAWIMRERLRKWAGGDR